MQLEDERHHADEYKERNEKATHKLFSVLKIAVNKTTTCNRDMLLNL